MGTPIDDAGDDPERKGEGELRDEIGLAVSGKLVDEMMGGALNHALDLPAQRARREGRRDDATMPQMLLPFHLQDGSAHDEPDAARVAPRREEVGVLQGREHVLVPHHEVAGSHPAGHRHDGPLATQARVDGIRVWHRAHDRASEQALGAFRLVGVVHGSQPFIVRTIQSIG
jgi:hypothetical protein